MKSPDDLVTEVLAEAQATMQMRFQALAAVRLGDGVPRLASEFLETANWPRFRSEVRHLVEEVFNDDWHD